MSRGQRLGLIALAVAVAAVAFVLARPDEGDEKADDPSPSTRTAPPAAEKPTATTDTRPEHRVVLRGGKPAGGTARIEVKRGDLVRMVIESDAPDQIHVHGYDIEKEARPDAPARFSFRAEVEGVFEVESHEAEHGGGDPLIARLVVGPS